MASGDWTSYEALANVGSAITSIAASEQWLTIGTATGGLQSYSLSFAPQSAAGWESAGELASEQVAAVERRFAEPRASELPLQEMPSEMPSTPRAPAFGPSLVLGACRVSLQPGRFVLAASLCDGQTALILAGGSAGRLSLRQLCSFDSPPLALACTLTHAVAIGADGAAHAIALSGLAEALELNGALPEALCADEEREAHDRSPLSRWMRARAEPETATPTAAHAAAAVGGGRGAAAPQPARTRTPVAARAQCGSAAPSCSVPQQLGAAPNGGGAAGGNAGGWGSIAVSARRRTRAPGENQKPSDSVVGRCALPLAAGGRSAWSGAAAQAAQASASASSTCELESGGAARVLLPSPLLRTCALHGCAASAFSASEQLHAGAFEGALPASAAAAALHSPVQHARPPALAVAVLGTWVLVAIGGSVAVLSPAPRVAPAHRRYKQLVRHSATLAPRRVAESLTAAVLSERAHALFAFCSEFKLSLRALAAAGARAERLASRAAAGAEVQAQHAKGKRAGAAVQAEGERAELRRALAAAADGAMADDEARACTLASVVRVLRAMESELPVALRLEASAALRRAEPPARAGHGVGFGLSPSLGLRGWRSPGSSAASAGGSSPCASPFSSAVSRLGGQRHSGAQRQDIGALLGEIAEASTELLFGALAAPLRQLYASADAQLSRRFAANARQMRHLPAQRFGVSSALFDKHLSAQRARADALAAAAAAAQAAANDVLGSRPPAPLRAAVRQRGAVPTAPGSAGAAALAREVRPGFHSMSVASAAAGGRPRSPMQAIAQLPQPPHPSALARARSASGRGSPVPFACGAAQPSAAAAPALAPTCAQQPPPLISSATDLAQAWGAVGRGGSYAGVSYALPHAAAGRDTPSPRPAAQATDWAAAAAAVAGANDAGAPSAGAGDALSRVALGGGGGPAVVRSCSACSEATFASAISRASSARSAAASLSATASAGWSSAVAGGAGSAHGGSLALMTRRSTSRVSMSESLCSLGSMPSALSAPYSERPHPDGGGAHGANAAARLAGAGSGSGGGGGCVPPAASAGAGAGDAAVAAGDERRLAPVRLRSSSSARSLRSDSLGGTDDGAALQCGGGSVELRGGRARPHGEGRDAGANGGGWAEGGGRADAADTPLSPMGMCLAPLVADVGVALGALLAARTPSGKVRAIERACEAVALHVQAAGKIGADELLPLIAYALVHARPGGDMARGRRGGGGAGARARGGEDCWLEGEEEEEGEEGEGARLCVSSLLPELHFASDFISKSSALNQGGYALTTLQAAAFFIVDAQPLPAQAAGDEEEDDEERGGEASCTEAAAKPQPRPSALAGARAPAAAAAAAAALGTPGKCEGRPASPGVPALPADGLGDCPFGSAPQRATDGSLLRRGDHIRRLVSRHPCSVPLWHHGLFFGGGGELDVVHLSHAGGLAARDAFVTFCSLAAFADGGVVERVEHSYSEPAHVAIERMAGLLGTAQSDVGHCACERLVTWAVSGEARAAPVAGARALARGSLAGPALAAAPPLASAAMVALTPGTAGGAAGAAGGAGALVVGGGHAAAAHAVGLAACGGPVSALASVLGSAAGGALLIRLALPSGARQLAPAERRARQGAAVASAHAGAAGAVGVCTAVAVAGGSAGGGLVSALAAGLAAVGGSAAGGLLVTTALPFSLALAAGLGAYGVGRGQGAARASRRRALCAALRGRALELPALECLDDLARLSARVLHSARRQSPLLWARRERHQMRAELRAACEPGRGTGSGGSEELTLLSAAATDAAGRAPSGGRSRVSGGSGGARSDPNSPPHSPSAADAAAIVRLRKKAADIALAYALWLGWTPRTPQLGKAALPAALARGAAAPAAAVDLSGPTGARGAQQHARSEREAARLAHRLLAPSYDELRADVRALLAACAAGSLFDEFEQRPPAGREARRALHAAKEAIVCLWELLGWAPHPLGLGPGRLSGPGARLTPMPRTFGELRERASRALADAPRDSGPADGPLLCACAICCRFEAVRAMADHEPDLVFALCGAPEGKDVECTSETEGGDGSDLCCACTGDAGGSAGSAPHPAQLALPPAADAPRAHGAIVSCADVHAA